MRAPSHTTGPTPAGRGLQQPGYGIPSPALLARADKGFARFLTRHATTGDTGPATDDARQR